MILQQLFSLVLDLFEELRARDAKLETLTLALLDQVGNVLSAIVALTPRDLSWFVTDALLWIKDPP
jgi:hypothetical protein